MARHRLYWAARPAKVVQSAENESSFLKEGLDHDLRQEGGKYQQEFLRIIYDVVTGRREISSSENLRREEQC